MPEQSLPKVDAFFHTYITVLLCLETLENISISHLPQTMEHNYNNCSNKLIRTLVFSMRAERKKCIDGTLLYLTRTRFKFKICGLDVSKFCPFAHAHG